MNAARLSSRRPDAANVGASRASTSMRRDRSVAVSGINRSAASYHLAAVAGARPAAALPASISTVIAD
jgi:hypothetical protein